MNRNAVNAFTTRLAILVGVAALLVASVSLAAQTKPVLVTDLKVGDWAEGAFGGVWTPITIAGPYDRGSYKVNWGTLVVSLSAYSNYIRHYTPTAADLAGKQGSAAAMQSRPTGPNGGKFGTREPATCPNRKTPPSAVNAKQYFVCDWEANLHPLEIDLVGDVAIELASPRPFNYSQDSNYPGIDVRSVVYEARGKYTSYICTANSPLLNDFANTHNCNAFPYPTAAGLCYKDNFGDWHCRMGGLSSGAQLKNQMPPAGF